MFKYFTLFLIFALLQSNAHATPLSGFEEYITQFIENHIIGLNKYKEEIEQLLSGIVNHNEKHKKIEDEMAAFKDELMLASNKGDMCAKHVTQLMFLEEPVKCPTIDDLISTAGKIITSTTNIITGSIHSFYLIFSDDQACKDISGFRCFLLKYHKTQDTVFSVLEDLKEYKKTALDLVKVYQDYFGPCVASRKMQVANHKQFYADCNNNLTLNP